MTKQEEIREVLAVRLYWKDHPTGDWSVELLQTKAIYYIQANVALSYLHSQGVVIKVDRELPSFPTGEDCLAWYSRVQQDMLRAGYETVEPLI